jgi:hypothetical protein
VPENLTYDMRLDDQDPLRRTQFAAAGQKTVDPSVMMPEAG